MLAGVWLQLWLRHPALSIAMHARGVRPRFAAKAGDPRDIHALRSHWRNIVFYLPFSGVAVSHRRTHLCFPPLLAFASCTGLCRLFCCPPVPSRIAGKLAFLPPKPPSYKLEYVFFPAAMAVASCDGSTHRDCMYLCVLSSRLPLCVWVLGPSAGCSEPTHADTV